MQFPSQQQGTSRTRGGHDGEACVLFERYVGIADGFDACELDHMLISHIGSTCYHSSWLRLVLTTGEKLVNFLLEPKKGTKWPSNLPRFTNRQAAITVCKELCRCLYIMRSDKRGKGELEVRTTKKIVSTAYCRVSRRLTQTCSVAMILLWVSWHECVTLTKRDISSGFMRVTRR